MKKLVLSIALLLAPLTSAKAYLMMTPTFMEFGSVKVGSIESQMFYLQNMGNQPVSVYGCSTFGSFYCNTNCYGNLMMGQVCMGTVYFKPNQPVDEFQVVTVMNSDSPGMIQVHGIGKK